LSKIAGISSLDNGSKSIVDPEKIVKLNSYVLSFIACRVVDFGAKSVVEGTSQAVDTIVMNDGVAQMTKLPEKFAIGGRVYVRELLESRSAEMTVIDESGISPSPAV
jgi:hypothetical protein